MCYTNTNPFSDEILRGQIQIKEMRNNEAGYIKVTRRRFAAGG